MGGRGSIPVCPFGEEKKKRMVPSSLMSEEVKLQNQPPSPALTSQTADGTVRSVTGIFHSSGENTLVKHTVPEHASAFFIYFFASVVTKLHKNCRFKRTKAEILPAGCLQVGGVADI